MENPRHIGAEEVDESLISKETILKYIRHWPWFVVGVVVSLCIGYVYMNVTDPTYSSFAEIKIINDDNQSDIASQVTSSFGFGGDVNLENEVAVLKSFRLLDQVVEELNLDIACYESGFFKSSLLWNPPFAIARKNAKDGLVEAREYGVEVMKEKFIVTDEDDTVYTLPFDKPRVDVPELPFHIVPTENLGLQEDRKYKVVVKPRKKTVFDLIENIEIEAVHKKSEVLSLSILGTNRQQSEAILNTIIDKFNQDGIADRQLVSKRTLDFIDERFMYLSGELDSIESGKQDFKKDNKLSNIQEDATFALRRKSQTDAEVGELRTQISLASLLKSGVLKQDAYSLLPSDIGLQNSSVNALVSDYNELALQRSKLITSVGKDHPSLQLLNQQLEQGKNNILKTVDVYQSQLRTSLGRLNRELDIAGDMFSELPEKEKTLRSIERQQSIKEKLFLLLLQKREEAAINYAITAPSFKIVDYAVTADKPVAPKKVLIYPLFFLMGLVVPAGLLYVRFAMDTTVHDASEIEKANPGIPLIGEIPSFQDTTVKFDFNHRSPLVESFRILSTNVDYRQPKTDNDSEGCHVIYVTSAVKGEGKTTVSLNLSLAYASLKKKVLLVGSDLRNPQLHKHFEGITKNALGLSDYLNDPKMDWQQCIQQGYGSDGYHKICSNGTVLVNPPELLSGPSFEKFIEKARNEFDYVIVDTAPTLLVTDTLLISKYADTTLFVVRAGFTEKNLLAFSRNLHNTKKMPNMAYVLNNAGFDENYGYNYGYVYGYENDNHDVHYQKRNYWSKLLRKKSA